MAEDTKNQNIGFTPLVNILILTYNQENYIAEAIESVLMQKTDFSYRIVIADDYSTDKTRKICSDYKLKYPDKIELVFHMQNLGAVKNFHTAYQYCTAKYLAMLDGDDYWTSPLKLQKQIDFLENNTDFSACFHQVHYLTLNGNENIIFPQNIKKEILEIDDIIALPTTGWIIMTSSVIYRKQDLGVLPNWFNKFKLGDWSLILLSALNGKIFFLNEVLGAYRINAGSLMQSSALSNIIVIKTLISIFKEFNKHANYKFKLLIYKQLQYLLFQLLQHYKDKKKWIHYYILTIEYNTYTVRVNHKKVNNLKDFLLLCFAYIRILPREVKHN
ncbi:MAG: glycosyltransferase [Bacteroidia bacterium]